MYTDRYIVRFIRVFNIIYIDVYSIGLTLFALGVLLNEMFARSGVPYMCVCGGARGEV